MNQKLSKIGYVAGMMIPFWIFIGVVAAGAMYPGYSHVDQALSELGAQGSPTHVLSPLINNYPLGILFIVFGASLVNSFSASRLARLTGILIAIHGVASILAGYFPCDIACNPEQPSTAQIIHNLSGLVMFVSLVSASGIWVYLSNHLYASARLRWFSLLCTAAAVIALVPMVTAIESGSGFGLYQRINYGASVLWVGGLAYAIGRRRGHPR
ncbi:DUF998 domain-containing protein [Spongiibacter sp.]|uniref:DUF998 domain-containing protein n=1 Tax=Spongiibacter sp. TaxID=2024860 RepID=UPI0035678771